MKTGHVKLTLDVGHFIGSFNVTLTYHPNDIENYEIQDAMSKYGDYASSEYINSNMDDSMHAEIIEQIKELETGYIQF
jgi:hypothetical protein